ncbi:MAG: hypothetical protein JMN25_07020 [gamma proteobacterium endosymbiont of Lamellibrachia anaximandri]|nr:hypothetical protein [gamma proteobacterium endosymbiont of Lamellibrachia anaximandri]
MEADIFGWTATICATQAVKFLQTLADRPQFFHWEISTTAFRYFDAGEFGQGDGTYFAQATSLGENAC